MAAAPAFREHSVLCSSLTGAGLHRMAYVEWGAADNPRVLVCVHGLTRCSRDFDLLAQTLAEEYRVICPDVAGRGRSEWLRNKRDYRFEQYVADMLTLIARLDVPEVHWLGTSMGGRIGMMLASEAQSPVTRLVLNDIGPTMSRAGLRAIVSYLGTDPDWASFDEAVAYVRAVSLSFGPHSDQQWQALTAHIVRQRDDGRWQFVYDPAISQMKGPLHRMIARVLLRVLPDRHPLFNQWPVYERVRCPVLALRGAESQLFSRASWLRMAECGPRAELAEIPGVGHAPTFLHPENIALVRDFLNKS